ARRTCALYAVTVSLQRYWAIFVAHGTAAALHRLLLVPTTADHLACRLDGAPGNLGAVRSAGGGRDGRLRAGAMEIHAPRFAGAAVGFQGGGCGGRRRDSSWRKTDKWILGL